eukprot:1184518-Prorocentrum_minimum.AAC.2
MEEKVRDQKRTVDGVFNRIQSFSLFPIRFFPGGKIRFFPSLFPNLNSDLNPKAKVNEDRRDLEDLFPRCSKLE